MSKHHWFKKQNWIKRNNWFGLKQRRNGPVASLGFVLALIGGVTIILLSLAALLNFAVYLPFHSPLVGYFGIGAISLVLGVVAVVVSKRANESIWAVALIIVGFLSGGIGGLLALIGGVLGLLSRYI